MHLKIKLNNELDYQFNYLIKLFVLVLFGALCVVEDYRMLSAGLVIVNLVLIYRARFQKVIFLMFAFFFMYSYSLLPYFWQGIDIAVYTDYNNPESFGNALKIHLLLFITFYCFYNPKKKDLYIKDNIIFYDYKTVFWVNSVILFFLIFLGKSGNSFLDGGYGTNQVEVVGGLSVYEYSPLFLLLGFIFSGNDKFKQKILLFFAFIYMFKSLMFGGRIETLQTMILLFIFWGEKKVSLKMILTVLVIAYFLGEVVNKIRGNPLLLIEGNYAEMFNVLDFSDREIIISNQGDVWYASTRLVGLVKDDIISFGDRLYSFLNWILSLFLPGRFVDPIANLANYLSDIYSTGGGGLISAYFYTWLSYPGVILIGLFISTILNKAYISKNNYLTLYSIMVFITFPRWFAYNPITMFKLSIYVLPLFFLYKNVKVRLNKRVSL